VRDNNIELEPHKLRGGQMFAASLRTGDIRSDRADIGSAEFPQPLRKAAIHRSQNDRRTQASNSMIGSLAPWPRSRSH